MAEMVTAVEGMAMMIMVVVEGCWPVSSIPEIRIIWNITLPTPTVMPTCCGVHHVHTHPSLLIAVGDTSAIYGEGWLRTVHPPYTSATTAPTMPVESIHQGVSPGGTGCGDTHALVLVGAG
jgi:hypothetical protein